MSRRRPAPALLGKSYRTDARALRWFLKMIMVTHPTPNIFLRYSG